MKKSTRWLLFVLIAASIGGVAWLVVGLYQQSSQQSAAATTQPSRIAKDKDGQTIVTLNSDEITGSGMILQPLVATVYQPAVIAYGTWQEDPSNSFIVRALFAGTLRAAKDHPYPSLGDTLPTGQVPVAMIEPSFTPVEHVDLASKLSAARADVATAKSALAAARAEYEADLKLNGQGKNVSDRTVEAARAKLDEQTAKFQSAQETVTFLKSAVAATAETRPSTTRPTAAVALLNLKGGCQVVEVTAHVGEIVDAGQAILRVTRFDSLIATVALPAGQSVDPASISARVVALGNEDHPLKVEKISVASTVDGKTLGQTLLIEVDTGGLPLRSGGSVTAYLTSSDKPPQGVLVPRDAVVWHEGKAWVYVQTAKNQFVRREVPTDRPIDQGWFVSAGLSPNQPIIVQGAQQLLSEEFKPVLPPGGDADD